MSTTIKKSTKVDFNLLDMAVKEKITSFSQGEASSKNIGILNILGDSEGVKLFNKFLCMRNSGHLLDFWFACKGFRSNVDPNNPDRLFQVAKVIYRTYVKSGASYTVPLPLAIKHEIVERMTSYHKGYKTTLHTQTKHCSTGIDRTLFDAAQENVGSLLEKMFYPQFLEYLQMNSVQATASLVGCSALDIEKPVGDFFSQNCPLASPKEMQKWRNKSFCQCSRTSSDDCHVATNPHGKFSPPSHSNDFCPVTDAMSLGCSGRGKLPIRMTTSWTTTSAQSPLLPIHTRSHPPHDSLPVCTIDCATCPCPEWDPSFSSPHCTEDKYQNKVCPGHPTDIADFTAVSSTASGARRHSAQSDPSNPTTGIAPLLSKVTTGLSQFNPDEDDDHDVKRQQTYTKNPINPTALSGHATTKSMPLKKDMQDRRADLELVKPRQNLAETDPAAFVLLLTNRLDKVKESRGKIEKLLSWVNQVDEKNAVDMNCSVSGSDTVDDLGFRPNPTTDQPITDEQMHCTAGQIQTSQQLQQPPKRFQDTLLAKPHSSYDLKSRVFVGPVEDEDAQGILDEHCSRIWADEQECPTGSSEARLSKRLNDQDCMTQSIPEPHDVLGNRTLRRSRGGHAASPNHVTARRRTALSAAMMHSFTGELDSTRIPNEPRRRSSMRTYNRSGTDARSTASWDSGVVANEPYASESPFTNGAAITQGDLETRSIVAAASLQALSSSNTELAMVNSEVTTKLVEHMTRHHRRPAQASTLQHDPVPQPLPSKLSPYQNYVLFSPPMYRSVYHHHHPTADLMTGKPASISGNGPPGMLDNPGLCVSCVQSNWRPCVCHQQTLSGWPGPVMTVDNCSNTNGALVTSGGGGPATSYSFPTASDTSSTFDSGISSTYDHLPTSGLSQNNPTDRGSRSQSLRNWHASFRAASSGGGSQHPIRAPSAPRPQCQSKNNNNPSMHICQPCSSLHSYPRSTDRTSEAAVPMCTHTTMYQTDNARERGVPECPNPCLGIDCCTCNRAITHNIIQNSDVNGKGTLQPVGCPAGSGQLLQHWLYLQTGQSVCSDDGPTTSQSKSSSQDRKPQHQQSRNHHHHHRRSSTTHHRHSSKHADLAPMNRESVELKQESITAGPTDSQEPVSATQTGPGLIVGYYLCDEPVPYRTVWTGTHTTPAASDSENQTVSTTCSSLTLGQFKQLIAKKGSYRYFFKKTSNEFGTGVVHEELTQDDAVIPLWDGKVVARIERAE